MERFWSKVIKTEGCWYWIASTDSSGYGIFRLNGFLEKAHRLSFKWSTGNQPKFCILHTCDTPSCVNPEHLFEGTRKDNNKDRDDKKRHVSNYGYSEGPSGTRAFSEVKVKEIRKLRNSGLIYTELAEQFNVSPSLIHRVVNKLGAYS